MVSTSEFRSGLKIELDGEPYVILEFRRSKIAQRGAIVRTKLKSLKTGRVLERNFRSGDKVDEPDLDERSMQYLYREENLFHFMDTATFEQVTLARDQMGDAARWLQENVVAEVLFHRGEPIGVALPTFVELRVAEAEPGVRGDTATGGSKLATLETGAVVQVPLFLNAGDVVKIDTRTGEYIDRVRGGG
ncbi:MAG: elongation factor P [Nitrospinota bacterium]